jgi:hypothetical protein
MEARNCPQVAAQASTFGWTSEVLRRDTVNGADIPSFQYRTIIDDE